MSKRSLIVPKSDECYRAAIFHLNRSDFNVPAEVLQEIELTHVARQSAEDRSKTEVIALCRAQIPGTPLPDPVQFREGDKGAILSLWLRQICPDSIRRMEGLTRDTELAQFIRKIVYIPTVTQQSAN